jgi:adenylate cyclase
VVLFLPFFFNLRGNWPIPAFRHLENLAYDLRVRLTMPGTVDDRIVIVDLDERSIVHIGQWPWPRSVLADLVDALFDDYGVRMVGWDMVFPEKDRNSGGVLLDRIESLPLGESNTLRQELEALRPALETDRILAEKLDDRNVVLGFVFRHAGDTGSDILTGELPPPLIPASEQKTHIPFIEAVAYTGNLAELQSAVPYAGFFENATLDRDGVYRRVPLLQQYQGALYESLGLAVARAALERPPIRFEFYSGSSGPRDGLDLEWLWVGDRKVPMDAQAAILVPYRGPAGSFPYVSALDVLDAKAPKYPLKDAIVLIGTSAPGLHDLRTTPVGERFNGVEIHANIVSGILDERMLQHPFYVRGIELVTLVFIGFLMTLVLAHASVLVSVLFVVGLLAAIVTANLSLWMRWGMVVPLATPLLYAFSVYVAQTVYGYFVEARGRRALSNLFGQYVPPELVEEMSSNPSHFDMTSDSREMTVLFSDVRGFTSIAETLAPRELSQLMNEFLTPMTKVIHRHRGTIDKYMGDAIMAFWGAPLADENHASNALLAAIEMQGALQELIPLFAKRGWPPVRIGIGLNTGMMRVGNMGSEFRMAYTVMGDSVNLGARIEGLTKTYGVTIAVGELTRNAVPDFSFLELDRVRVRGKDRPVAIYEPLGPRNGLDQETRSMLRRYHEALKFYRSGEWEVAEQEFYQLHQAYRQRKIFQIYLDRLAHYRNYPPGDDWDGVFSYGDK